MLDDNLLLFFFFLHLYPARSLHSTHGSFPTHIFSSSAKRKLLVNLDLALPVPRLIVYITLIFLKDLFIHFPQLFVTYIENSTTLSK